MRIFVGLDLPSEIRQRISVFMGDLRRRVPDAKWVSPESLHVTLKFIGERPEEQVKKISPALASVHVAPFEIGFRQYGFFPATGSARVFWIGVEAGERLRELAHMVDEVAASFGVEPEKAYAPHLTLARTRSPQRRPVRKPVREPHSGEQNARIQAELAAAPQPEFGTMTARDFFLFV
ncbi:MAG: RNA 2',3'-cyclic phosphodiesterase, partial [Candidatus Korobacteraceae bacterium]